MFRVVLSNEIILVVNDDDDIQESSIVEFKEGNPTRRGGQVLRIILPLSKGLHVMKLLTNANGILELNLPFTTNSEAPTQLS
jgi:hypothetical protein